MTLASNLREFPPTDLIVYGDAGERYVFRFVNIGVLFAETLGVHFSALHGSSFLLICNFRWCESCTNSASYLCEFPLTTLYGDAGDEYVCRFVTVGVLFAQTPGLHFSAHHGFSFLLIYLRWCKSCTKVNFSCECV